VRYVTIYTMLGPYVPAAALMKHSHHVVVSQYAAVQLMIC
jgi:hypothetical protein